MPVLLEAVSVAKARFVLLASIEFVGTLSTPMSRSLELLALASVAPIVDKRMSAFLVLAPSPQLLQQFLLPSLRRLEMAMLEVVRLVTLAQSGMLVSSRLIVVVLPIDRPMLQSFGLSRPRRQTLRAQQLSVAGAHELSKALFVFYRVDVMPPLLTAISKSLLLALSKSQAPFVLRQTRLDAPEVALVPMSLLDRMPAMAASEPGAFVVLTIVPSAVDGVLSLLALRFDRLA